MEVNMSVIAMYEYAPEPNAYKQAGPSFSMGFIRNEMLSTKQTSPGPADYKIPSEFGGNPAYSMGLRNKEVSVKEISPSPDTYDLQNYKPGDEGPKYSFGIRHSPRSPPMVVKGDNECYKYE